MLLGAHLRAFVVQELRGSTGGEAEYASGCMHTCTWGAPWGGWAWRWRGALGGTRGCLVISWRMWQSGRGGYLITGTLRQHTVTPPGVSWPLALVALDALVEKVALIAQVAQVAQVA